MPTPPSTPKSGRTPPQTYADARTIGEHFGEGTPVIMNLTEMVVSDAKRLIDFAAGAMRGDRTGPGFAGVARAFAGLAARYRAGGRGVWAGRAMRTAARLMPRAVGERWLGEAESFLFEAAPAQRAKVTRNYLITAPQVIVAGWAAELARRARRPVTGRAAAEARRS